MPSISRLEAEAAAPFPTMAQKLGGGQLPGQGYSTIHQKQFLATSTFLDRNQSICLR